MEELSELEFCVELQVSKFLHFELEIALTLRSGNSVRKLMESGGLDGGWRC